MLTQSVYLVGVWLALSLIMALLFGKRVHHSDFITSMIYLILIVVIGDYILLWLGIPVRTIYFASVIVVAVGILIAGLAVTLIGSRPRAPRPPSSASG